MGKYMRKVKITGEVAVMELAQSSFGVRTRAKTLALQNKTPTSSSPTDSAASCYLQLRSRRLEKKPLSLLGAHKNQQTPLEDPNPRSNSRTNSRLGLDSGSIGSVSLSFSKNNYGGDDYDKRVIEEGHSLDFGVEASFGENVLETEVRGRSTRETTPCSLIRGSDTLGTPGSTTRATRSSATNQRIRNSRQRNIPTTNEVEEFFASAEQQQQRIFIEKYNFDPVNEAPLPGRYEWERVEL